MIDVYKEGVDLIEWIIESSIGHPIPITMLWNWAQKGGLGWPAEVIGEGRNSRRIVLQSDL